MWALKAMRSTVAATRRGSGHRSPPGFTLSHLGDHQSAVEYCQRALDLHRAVGNRHGEALTWDSLGYAHRQLGHHAQAVACFRRALTAYRQLGGDRYRQTVVLTHLGDAFHAAGGSPAACDAWRSAWSSSRTWTTWTPTRSAPGLPVLAYHRPSHRPEHRTGLPTSSACGSAVAARAFTLSWADAGRLSIPAEQSATRTWRSRPNGSVWTP